MHEASTEIIGIGISYLSPLFSTEHNTSMYVREHYGIMVIGLPLIYTEIGTVSPPFLELQINKSDIILSPFFHEQYKCMGIQRYYKESGDFSLFSHFTK